jgi:hypothetical protein
MANIKDCCSWFKLGSRGADWLDRSRVLTRQFATAAFALLVCSRFQAGIE